MKSSMAIMAAIMFCAGSALAQAPTAAPSGTQPKPAQHQPGVSSNPSAKAKDPAAPPTLEKPDPSKEAAVRKLMEVTQTNKMGEGISAALTSQVRQVMGRAVPPEQLQKFMDDFSQKFAVVAPPSNVTDAIVPVYARHFSTEDIQALIQFYESPLGQRVVKTMPQVTQESEAAGIQLEQKAAIDVLRQLQDQYPQLKQMLPPEGGGQPGPGTGVAPNPGGPAPNNGPVPAAPPNSTPK